MRWCGNPVRNNSIHAMILVLDGQDGAGVLTYSSSEVTLPVGEPASQWFETNTRRKFEPLLLQFVRRHQNRVFSQIDGSRSVAIRRAGFITRAALPIRPVACSPHASPRVRPSL